MDLRVTSIYNVPSDLEEQFKQKIEDAKMWLEQELIERGIVPNKCYMTRDEKTMVPFHRGSINKPPIKS